MFEVPLAAPVRIDISACKVQETFFAYLFELLPCFETSSIPCASGGDGRDRGSHYVTPHALS